MAKCNQLTSVKPCIPCTDSARCRQF